MNWFTESKRLLRACLLLLPLLVIPPLAQARPYKGWGYLVDKLRKMGVDSQDLQVTYNSKRMPERPFVPFALKPGESRAIYKGFLASDKLRNARRHLEKYFSAYQTAERLFKVDRHVINGILLVETQFGENTGKHPVLVRLSRGASVGEPSNVKKNVKRLQRLGEPANLQNVSARAVKVEQIFLPELVALFKMKHLLKINIFNVRGSIAGAFGLPQFMPSSYLRYAVDGNKNRRTSLYEVEDAIHSVGNYLAEHGWRNEASFNEKRDVVLTYNKSIPYAETVLDIAHRTKR